jgi:intein/homing endonuclease
MANKNLTIFQRLGQVIGPDSAKLKNVYNQPQRFNLGKDLLKTTDKKEFELAKLQAQQNKYLSQMWKKVENGLYQQSINYETTRIGSYADFEAMEFYPIIAAALDIIMEEATTINDKGKVLNVYSESNRVKTILQDLFFNRLDIHTSLPMWTRNTVKYGDNFLFLNINDKHGITGAKQMPNYEMERRESGLFDMITGNYTVNNDVANSDKVKFYWRGRDVEFNSWQMAHFRLLGDDRRLPYGTCLKGDTRINTEFGVEEISKIQVGTNVWSFNTETQEKELSPILDKIMSGTKEVFKVSTKHNFIDASKEHKILVATESGDFIYKNVCDLKIGDLLVLNKNEHTNKTILINKSKPNENKNGWFNNIELIPDTVTEEFAQLFGFLIGDGWLTTDNSKVEFALGTDVETNEYYISLLEKFSGCKMITNNKQATLHSKMLKTILERMGFSGKSYEKRIPNWVFEMDTILQKAFVAGLMDADGWATRDQWVVGLHIELNNKELIEDLKILLQRIGYKSGSIRSRLRKEPIIEGRQIKTVRESHMITFYDSYLTQMKKYEFKNRKTDNFILEPIQSIESIGEFETYDIYVKNENHNFYANNIIVHNSILEKSRRIWKQLILAEDSMLVYRVTRAPERRVYKIYVGNIDDADVPAYVNEIADRFKRTPIVDSQTGQMDLRFNQLSNDQDFFIPVRSEDSPNPIETLPGASNLDQIADIEYLRNNLFTALRIPKPFLGFDEASGEGKNLALQDIRFSRTVNRVQQSMLQELNKIAIIHLYLLGFEDDLDNFSLTLNNPSTQAEMLKVEHLQQKITLLKDAVSDTGNGFGTMSWTRAHREILGWSNDEIKKDLLEQRMEKAASSELANTPNVIKHTGMFDDVDKIYGNYEAALQGGGEAQAGGAEGGSAPVSSGGGFGGGGGLDLGGGTETSELGGETGTEAGTETGGETAGATPPAETAGAEAPSPEATLTESINLLDGRKKLLNDKLTKRTTKYNNRFVDLIESVDKLDETKPVDNIKIYDKNVKINDDINQIINDIDKMLDE